MTDNNPGRKYLIEEYRSRINRVIDYIESNIDRPLTLRELSDVAGFSSYHFHRIFSGMVGETLYGFIQRIRLEKAALKLVLNQRKTITEISLDVGFTSMSAFARAFREKFGMSATKWRTEGYNQYSKNGTIFSNQEQLPDNIGQDYRTTLQYNRDNKNNTWRIEMTEGSLKTDVEVKDLPEMTVAYLRHIGPYQGDTDLFGRLFGQLMTWAGARNLLNFPETKLLTVYYDDPDMTDDSKLRMDVCITVPENTKVDGEIGKSKISAGQYAVAHFEIDSDQYSEAWKTVYSVWLPQSGYEPADGPCFELCPADPDSYGEKTRHVVDICIPVKPL
ncbi:MAG: AraC family transcriptional regulator [Dehalococcoidales bacterium]|nr:AraC family transcriptional regulator [Dehalococcoidales bacterium]